MNEYDRYAIPNSDRLRLHTLNTAVSLFFSFPDIVT